MPHDLGSTPVPLNDALPPTVGESLGVPAARNGGPRKPSHGRRGFGPRPGESILVGSFPGDVGFAHRLGPVHPGTVAAPVTSVVSTHLGVDILSSTDGTAFDAPRSSRSSPAALDRARGLQEVDPMGQAIVAREIHKGYGSGRERVPIIRGVSLSAAPGETVFLVGPSGSGKTTLLSILGCILTPDRGTVRVLGRDVSAMRPSALAAFRRQHFGFIFQTFNLFPTLSALDNVRMAMALRGTPRRAASARAAELLDRVGLGGRLRTRPSKLSTGESQRVAIARALAGDPSVLLADEPTAALDAENGQAVMRMLTDLTRERGLTLLIVTHDNRISPFADRILRLEDGRLVGPAGAGLADPRPRVVGGAGTREEAVA
jgi:putative ABC transport system ATP-binding protein